MFGFLFGIVGDLLDLALWLILLAALGGVVYVSGAWVYQQLTEPESPKTLKDTFLEVIGKIRGLIKKLW